MILVLIMRSNFCDHCGSELESSFNRLICHENGEFNLL
ncbi:hypothetical protein SHVI106290_18770 [Shewanella violacea]